ncbi:MAG: hypothetical protein GY723_19690 [bacterium]|nr:hypothetical protein [bacterium]MCP5070041.1 hypothetical protein [bacterium]
MKVRLFAILLLGALPIWACSSCEKKAPHPMRDALGQLPEDGQLSKEVAEDAAATHDGSFLGPGGARPGTPGAASANGVIVGPLRAEEVPPHLDPATGDAGLALRGVIGQRIASVGALSLHDAPEERLVDDSPRPDLARKGVRFVVKGTLKFSKEQGEVLVLLRAVETRSGKIVEFTSARGTEADAVARDAADRLAEKLAARIGGGAS